MRWVKRVGALFLALVVGSVITELIFRWRDGGAFPHLNLYLPDAELGVRLEPGADERFKFGNNPATSVHINSAGFRGADWPAPAESDIIVVGDSQAFGLGVEAGDTFSARLEALLGGKRHVLNAGVPTYGPREYLAVARRLLEQRKARTVILTINLANDLFEVDRPNKDRHVVWDGWAVRKESAPTAPLAYPGRRWLMSRSHAVYAFRRWLHRKDAAAADDRGFASEGTWTDLVGAGQKAALAHGEAEKKARSAEAARAARGQALARAEHELRAADDKLDKAASADHDVRGEDGSVTLGQDSDFGETVETLEVARASPGDIVEAYGEESSRSVVATSALIAKAARARKAILQRLKDKAARKKQQALLATFDVRDQLVARLAQLDSQVTEADGDTRLPSPLAGFLADAKSVCDAHGARLIVLILPIDVQVSPQEWKKYGAPPRDMGATLALIEDIHADASALGISALDVTRTLAAAEPGAFLDGDIHLTPKGHAAVAVALQGVLAEPPPAPAAAAQRQAPRLAPGRSPVPPPAIWDGVGEIAVRGSTAAGCETKRVREWLRVACRPTSEGGMEPTALKVLKNEAGDDMTLVLPGATTLLVPLVPGKEVEALFSWTEREQALGVRWPDQAGKPEIAFAEAKKLATKQPPVSEKRLDPAAQALCGCWKQVYGTPRCNSAYGEASPGCAARYGKSCEQLLLCARRDPAAP